MYIKLLVLGDTTLLHNIGVIYFGLLEICVVYLTSNAEEAEVEWFYEDL